jgi:hypothetical protein
MIRMALRAERMARVSCVADVDELREDKANGAERNMARAPARLPVAWAIKPSI